jgi:MFS family permease
LPQLHTLKKIRQNPLALPIYLPSLIFAFAQGLLIPIMPLYAGSFGATYGMIGLVMSAAALGAVLGDLPAGLLIRRLGRKNGMLVGLVTATFSTVLLFWSPSLVIVIACRMVGGFGIALFGIACFTYIADVTPVAARGRSIALVGGVFRIGKFAGPVVAGAVAASQGLRFPFLIFGAAGAAALVIVLLFTPTLDEDVRDKEALSAPQHNFLGSVLKSHYRLLMSAGAGFLFMQIIRSGPIIILPLFASDVLGLDVQDIGIVMSSSAAVEMTLFYPVGLLMDRRGRKVAIVSSLLFMTAGLALLPAVGSFLSLLWIALLLGFGNGLGSGTMMTLGADLAPPNMRGEFLGLWRLIGDVGGTGGPLVIGGVADLFSLQPTMWVIAGMGLIAVSIFYWRVPETLKKPSKKTKAISR